MLEDALRLLEQRLAVGSPPGFGERLGVLGQRGGEVERQLEPAELGRGLERLLVGVEPGTEAQPIRDFAAA